ncbi:hypothetical protein FKM82_025731 [Ascaphus truei]
MAAASNSPRMTSSFGPAFLSPLIVLHSIVYQCKPQCMIHSKPVTALTMSPPLSLPSPCAAPFPPSPALCPPSLCPSPSDLCPCVDGACCVWGSV